MRRNRQKIKLIASVALYCISLIALIMSADRVTYTNPNTVAFSFTYRIGVVGDSWSQKSPFDADIRVGKGGASIEEIKHMVQNTRHIRIETVYIVAGVANTACHEISVEDTLEEMPGLIELCRKKFSPRTIIAYDPRLMWQLLENPEYCDNPSEVPITVDSRQCFDFHINSRGYEELKQSRPLSFVSR